MPADGVSIHECPSVRRGPLTGHKNNHEQHCEFSNLAEQAVWEERLLRDGEVVDKASHQSQDTHDNGCNHGCRLPGMPGGSGPCQSDQEYGQTAGVKHEANIINLLNLLPAGLLEVVLWPWRGVVEEYSTDHAQDTVYDTL
jgi:hypothetical protein